MHSSVTKAGLAGLVSAAVIGIAFAAGASQRQANQETASVSCCGSCDSGCECVAGGVCDCTDCGCGGSDSAVVTRTAGGGDTGCSCSAGGACECTDCDCTDCACASACKSATSGEACCPLGSSEG